MAAYAAIVSLMNNIEQIKSHPHLSSCFDNEQIRSLLQEAGSLLDFIESYNHGGSATEEVEALERRITSAAHAAEDVIESHVVDQIQIHARSGQKGSPNAWNKVLDWVRRIAYPRTLDLRQLIQDMAVVAEEAMEVMEMQGSREEDQPPTHPTTPLAESGMVGLDDELTQLLDSLTDHRPNRHVVSIVGMGGTGKTTLAHSLYVNPLTIEHFDIRAWVTVSQRYDVRGILLQLLSCLGKPNNNNNIKVDELGEELYKTLYGRRYLIVLDDIWGVEAWDKVRRYLPDDGNSSRVVLTTRLSNVANVCASICFNLNLLDEDRSWRLFCEKALFPHKDDPLQLEDVAKEIVKSCKGLALSIVVIGGLLLKSPRTIGYWKNVLKGLEKGDSEEKQQGLDALSLSYNHLPPHLKPCFLYMGVFDEDSRICVSNITRLWIAEGFIKPKGTRILEEIAEDFLKDLSDRNLVLGVRRRHTGKIKSFSVHDLIRDLCIKVAERQQLFHVRRLGEEILGTERRLVCDLKKREFGNALARTLLGGNFFPEQNKYKLMRVLEANENTFVNSVEQIYGNVNLRYLAHGLILMYPSVCLVWNLQTLLINVGSHSPLVVAPLEIWKMQHLRHVKCKKLYLRDSYEQEYCSMEYLQTLKTIVNFLVSDEVCEMIPNIKKLGLLYNDKLQWYDDCLIDCLCNLDRFGKLESLNLTIITSKRPSLDLDLDSDSDSYPTANINTKLKFPLSLNKLCLSECGLSWEDVSLLGSLPHLQVLHLRRRAVTVGELWSPIIGQFLRLKFLNIEFCDLRSWDADNSHFPVLEKLVLFGLIFLKEIPMEIGEIATLGLIHVNRCSESAAISALKIKQDQLENHDNDALLIEVVVNESDLESFKKNMEEEELAHNLFKLNPVATTYTRSIRR